MYERCYALGGEDPLFVSMDPEVAGDSKIRGRFGPSNDRVLGQGDQLVFSYEQIGRLGYWIEFARMVVIGEPTGTQVPMNRPLTAGLEAGAVEMRPDRHLDEVPPAILDAVAAHGARSSYMANTYLVTATGGEALSTKPLDVYVIS